jgi:hypothetical protein
MDGMFKTRTKVQSENLNKRDQFCDLGMCGKVAFKFI